MTRYDPPDYGANEPTAYGNYGYGPGGGGYGQPAGGGYPPEPEPEPTPGWRKPLALVGWGVLIAVLIALIIYGIVLLARGRPSPATITTTVTTVAPATTTTTAPSTARTTTTTTTTTTTCAWRKLAGEETRGAGILDGGHKHGLALAAVRRVPVLEHQLIHDLVVLPYLELLLLLLLWMSQCAPPSGEFAKRLAVGLHVPATSS